MSRVYGRGRLTDDDRDRIDELAAQGKKASAIAREIKRHPSTVHWYMYTQGHAIKVRLMMLAAKEDAPQP